MKTMAECIVKRSTIAKKKLRHASRRLVGQEKQVTVSKSSSTCSSSIYKYIFPRGI